MKINSIEWHKENLKNWKISNDNKQEQIKREQKNLEESIERWKFYELQISKAQILGKDRFDREKFLVKRKPRKTTPSKDG